MGRRIIEFDKALKKYIRIFSDAKYYKICLARLESKKCIHFIQKLKMLKKGYTINEDNTVYETYPYQKKWTN
jgi:hypothetical protein